MLFCKKKSVLFLGHIIDEKGISTDPEELKLIREYPRPRFEGVRQVLGYISYYRKIIY